MARCIQHTLGPVFSNRLHADGFRGIGPVVIPNLVLFFTLLSHPVPKSLGDFQEFVLSCPTVFLPRGAAPGKEKRLAQQ